MTEAVTLGVDLAAQDERTAVCALEWTDSGVGVLALEDGVSDDRIVELAGRASVVAIGAPFGWPRAFTSAIAEYAAGEPWPYGPSLPLRMRATDQFVRETIGRWPLSVSSERIAMAAMRAARLLSRLGPGRPAARDGSDGVIEVYPAGALRCWGLPASGYKRGAGSPRRAELAAALMSVLPALTPIRDAMEESDDCLDAVIAALVARAHQLGATTSPSDMLAETAKVEGWIWLPTGGLDSLVGPTSL